MRTCLNQTNCTTKVNNMQVSKILILFKGLSPELMEIAFIFNKTSVVSTLFTVK